MLFRTYLQLPSMLISVLKAQITYNLLSEVPSKWGSVVRSVSLKAPTGKHILWKLKFYIIFHWYKQHSRDLWLVILTGKKRGKKNIRTNWEPLDMVIYYACWWNLKKNNGMRVKFSRILNNRQKKYKIRMRGWGYSWEWISHLWISHLWIMLPRRKAANPVWLVSLSEGSHVSTETARRRPCGDAGRDWSDRAASHRTWKIANDHLLGRRTGGFFPVGFRRSMALHTPRAWTSDLWNCVRQYSSVV